MADYVADFSNMSIGSVTGTGFANYPRSDGETFDYAASTARSYTSLVDTHHRLLPHDLGLRNETINAPQQWNRVADELIMTLRKRGYHVIVWQNSCLVYTTRTGGRYRRVADADTSSALPDMVRNVMDGAYFTHRERAPRADRDEGVEFVETARPWQMQRSVVAEIVAALETRLRLPSDIPSGTWLDAQFEETYPSNELIVTRNGLLHVGREKKRELIPHNPRFFSDVFVDINYDSEARCPEWLKFLAELFPDDPQTILTLQEWFGYVLSRDTSLQKILLLVGPPRGGKGTIAWVLEQLLGGPSEVDHPKMSRLGETFGLAPMLGKALAIIGDARISGDTKPLVETLLTISGEDSVSVNRKNRFELNIKLGIRFMVLTNETPSLRDNSGAMANRFVPIHLTESWLGREDLGLKDRLRQEFSGILNWALDGLDRLRTQRSFTMSDSSNELMELLIETSSPVRSFINEFYVEDPEGSVPKADIFTHYKAWATRRGYSPGADTTFARDLRAAYPKVKSGKPGPRGAQIPSFMGIRLVNPLSESPWANR